MKIHKVLNNNMVRSINQHNQEVIVLGKGLGFKKNVGDEIDESLIEKTYQLQSEPFNSQLENILSLIDFENLQIVNEIIQYAESVLRKQLNPSIYISLADHLHYALSRFKEGKILENNLHQEIKLFYQIEYRVGQYALQIIKQRFGLDLPEDEASYIAMHILNAQLNKGIFTQTNFMTEMISEILEIVNNFYNGEVEVDGIYYERFISHLKFFSVRLMNDTKTKEVDPTLFKMITIQYSQEYKCALEIRDFLNKKYNKRIFDSELMYLTIHINVLKMRNV